MIDRLTLKRIFYAMLFLMFGFISVFIQLLPLDFMPRRAVWPDVMLGLVCAWVLRRPDFVPVPLIAVVFLFLDFMLQQVPGIWSLMVVIGTEALRAREASLRGSNFIVEWALVTIVVLLMVIGKRILLTVFFVGQPALGQELLVILVTILIYPLLVGFSVFLLRVRKLNPGEEMSMGHSV